AAVNKNYSINPKESQTRTFATIRPGALVEAVEDLIYDGTDRNLATASAAGGTLVWCLEESGEYVAHVPMGKAAGDYTVWYKLVDADGAQLTEPKSVATSIAAKSVTITGLGASDKVYDGGATATVTGEATLDGKVTGDAVSITGGSASFNDKTAADGKTVTFSGYALEGDDAGNYTLSAQPASVMASITKKPVSISGLSADDKPYDGNKTVRISGSPSISDIIGDDQVSVSAGSAQFDDKNVGEDKDVSFTGFGLTGADAGNYELSAQPSTTASITAKSVTISGITAQNKTYDGTADATVTGTATIDGKVDGDDVSISAGTASFEDKNAGADKTVTFSGYTLTGDDAGNYTLSQPADQTATINQLVAELTWQDTSFSYDGTNHAPTATVNNLQGEDTCDVTVSGAQKTAGTHVATATALSNQNYQLPDTATQSFSIAAQALTITGLGASNKVYDGTVTATPTGAYTLTGKVGTDDVTVVAGTAVFESKNVGTDKTVTFSGYTLAGDDAGNYTLSQPASVTANITRKLVSITGVEAENKVYDGTTAATPSGTATVNGKVAGDKVNVAVGSASFADKNVGTGKTVTFSDYRLTGDDAGNYELRAQPASVTANITKKPVSIDGLSANNKVYDGTTTAAINGDATLNGAISGDAVSLREGSASFESKNAGSNKDVTFAGYGLEGDDAGNYTLSQPASVRASITQKLVTISGLSASNKVYDGTTTATINGTPMLSGVLDGDKVSVSAGSGSFANKTAGSGKTVSFTGYALSGNDAGNYRLSAQPASVTADITRKLVSISGIEAANKVYDGTTAATPSGTATVNGKVAGDRVNVAAGTASFKDKNVGTGKVVIFKGYALEGDDAGNYELRAQPEAASANITKKRVTIGGLSVSDKVYDGTTTAAINGDATLNGAISGDAVSLREGSASFESEDAGSNKDVTFKGYALDGDDAGNYTLSQPASVKANITKKPVTINGVGVDNKVYDGTTTATVTGTPTLSGVLDGDKVSVTAGSASFATKTVGTGKAVNFKGYALSGANAGNYRLSAQPASVKANITKKRVTIAGLSASNKVYDGNATATPSGKATVNGKVGSDKVSVTAGTASFEDENAGSGKTVTFKGYALGGADAANYQLSAQPAATTASITKRTASLKWTNTSFTYDAKSHRPKATVSNLVSGDKCATTVAGAKTDAGSYTATATKLANANYRLPAKATCDFSIAKAKLTSIADVADKTYTGKAIAPKPAVKAGSTALDAGTEFSYAYKANTNAGTAAVTATGKGNYTGTVKTTFKIVPAKLTSIAPVANMAYTGKAIAPKPAVKAGSTALDAGTDFSYAYKANTNAGTAAVTATGKGNYTGAVKTTFKIVKPTIQYKVHRQTYGNEPDWKKNGQVSGTTGEAKRLEAIWIDLGTGFPVSGGIQYRTHVQTYGWQAWKEDGALSGTTGEAKRLEAIEIRLTGAMTKKYDVYYRVHAETYGWMGWAKNGASAGTAGMRKRLEAIQVVLVPKGADAPSATYKGIERDYAKPFAEA
ncbi:MAG: hypothetical protein IKF14_10235, partial [Atopobiaceae bacterium]|nr:hypothetical protein [Atopobiaceae bacterium]